MTENQHENTESILARVKSGQEAVHSAASVRASLDMKIVVGNSWTAWVKEPPEGWTMLGFITLGQSDTGALAMTPEGAFMRLNEGKDPFMPLYQNQIKAECWKQIKEKLTRRKGNTEEWADAVISVFFGDVECADAARQLGIEYGTFYRAVQRVRNSLLPKKGREGE